MFLPQTLFITHNKTNKIFLQKEKPYAADQNLEEQQQNVNGGKAI